jgi:hypothetical protein
MFMLFPPPIVMMCPLHIELEVMLNILKRNGDVVHRGRMSDYMWGLVDFLADPIVCMYVCMNVMYYLI